MDPAINLTRSFKKLNQVSRKLSTTKLNLLLCFINTFIALFVAELAEILALVPLIQKALNDTKGIPKRGPGRPKGSTKSPAVASQVINLYILCLHLFYCSNHLQGKGLRIAALKCCSLFQVQSTPRKKLGRPLRQLVHNPGLEHLAFRVGPPHWGGYAWHAYILLHSRTNSTIIPKAPIG